MKRGKRYDHMTPAEQRQVDERDAEILRMLDAGKPYAEIQRVLGVTAPTIAKVKRECAE